MFQKRVSLKINPEKIKNVESLFEKIKKRENKKNCPDFYIDPEILVFMERFNDKIITSLNKEFSISGFLLKDRFSHEEIIKESEEKGFKKIYNFEEAFIIALCLMSRSICDDARIEINIYFNIEGVLYILTIDRQNINDRLNFLVSWVDQKFKNERFCTFVF